MHVFSAMFFLFLFTLTCSDYKTGFGGQFGIQTDRMDKSSLGWDHHERLEKHVSQKGGGEAALQLASAQWAIFEIF
jgi:hypothetical protein